MSRLSSAPVPDSVMELQAVWPRRDFVLPWYHETLSGTIR